jgi:hypothetical protein
MVLRVMFRGLMSVMRGVQSMRMRDMSVMPCLLVIAGFVVFGGFAVMVRGGLVVLGSGLVMLGRSLVMLVDLVMAIGLVRSRGHVDLLLLCDGAHSAIEI